MASNSIRLRTRSITILIAALAAWWVTEFPFGAAAQSAWSNVLPVADAPGHRIVVESNEVEPAHAKVKLKEDAWLYTQASKWSRKIRQVHAGKFINVTGSTHYYLRVKLKDGKVGYISPSTVELVTHADKSFILTMNSPVYDRPNRWGTKLAEVHKGYPVHVVGFALEYLKIRMKDGREGYIPTVALE
jgi:hypothetical protein